MAEPTSWRAFTSSPRCQNQRHINSISESTISLRKKGIEGVISRPLFHHSRWSLSLGARPFRSAASYAGPHLEQCYQVLPSDCWNTEPAHQPYHSKPLALTCTQHKSTDLKLWAPLSLVPLQVDSEQVQFEPSISTELAIDGNIRALPNVPGPEVSKVLKTSSKVRSQTPSKPTKIAKEVRSLMSTHTFKTNIPGTSISSGIQWTLYISCNLESTGCQHQHQLIPGKLRFFVSAKLLKGHFLAQIQVTQTHKLVETSYDQLSRYRHYWNDIEVGTCSLTPMLLCFFGSRKWGLSTLRIKANFFTLALAALIWLNYFDISSCSLTSGNAQQHCQLCWSGPASTSPSPVSAASSPNYVDVSYVPLSPKMMIYECPNFIGHRSTE